MKFQTLACPFCLLLLIVFTMPIFANAQDTARAWLPKTPIFIRPAKHVQHTNFNEGYDDWAKQRLHGGVAFSIGFMNAPGSIDAALAWYAGFDLLKYKWYATSIETGMEYSIVDSKDFLKFPLLLEQNFSFGITKHKAPVWGFYFGGGISYVIDSYLKTMNDANSANFWGCELNGGLRFGNLDIGFAKVISLRDIDQIPNPALYEITLGSRF